MYVDSFSYQWQKKFFRMRNIFIVPAMQHGCHAKPLFLCQSPYVLYVVHDSC